MKACSNQLRVDNSHMFSPWQSFGSNPVVSTNVIYVSVGVELYSKDLSSKFV